MRLEGWVAQRAELENEAGKEVRARCGALQYGRGVARGRAPEGGRARNPPPGCMDRQRSPPLCLPSHLISNATNRKIHSCNTCQFIDLCCAADMDGA